MKKVMKYIRNWRDINWRDLSESGSIFSGSEKEFLNLGLQDCDCSWFENENGKVHNNDGPALFAHFIGSKEWIIEGITHREDGPAIIYSNGIQEWFLFGELFSDWFPMNYLFSC